MINRSKAAPAIAGALLASCMVLTGCGGRTKVTDAPPPQESVQTEYRIGPGDSLQVFVWNHPELTVTVPVRPDGLISTPLVENMEAGGKTPSQLSRDLEKALAEYVRTPTVNVIVTSFVGALADKPLVTQTAFLVPGSQHDLPHASLGVQGGGEVMTSARDPNKPQVEQFVIRVEVDNPSEQYLPGQRAYVRMTLDQKRPLVWQWYRRLLQLIETKSAKSQWT